MAETNPYLLKALKHFGDSRQALADYLAERLGRPVSREQVNHWLNNGVKMPLEIAFLIEFFTEDSVKAEDLRPDIAGPINELRDEMLRRFAQKDVAQ